MKLIDFETGEEVGLYDLAEYFIEKYPKDIFIKKPVEIVKIRKLMEDILKKHQTGEYR